MPVRRFRYTSPLVCFAACTWLFFSPGSVHANSESAELAILRGDYQAARKILEPIARQQRGGADAAYHQFNVARVSFANGDFRRAKRDCAKIKPLVGAKQADASATFWFHLCNARALLTNQRAALAEPEMKLAVEALGSKDFGLEHLHIALATVLIAEQRQEHKAAAEFAGQHLSAAAQSELSGDPSVPYLIVRLIIERAKNERSPKAQVGCYEEALRRMPNHPDALLGLGIAQANGELLRKAEQARPGWLEPLRHLAELTLASGKSAESFETAKRILKVEKHDATAIRIAALSAVALEDKSAWRRLGHALDIMPNDAQLLMAEARLLHQKGKHEDALEKLERVAALQTTKPQPYIECAKIAFATSRPRLAAGFLDQALKRDPRNAEAKELCKQTTCNLQK